MKSCILCGLVAVLALAGTVGSARAEEEKAMQKNVAVEKTRDGDLVVQPINHSAIRFEFKGKQYYVDPSGKADWDHMPKADAIFVTHEHYDHLDPGVIGILKTSSTAIWMNAASVQKAAFGNVINVGEERQVLDITVEAVPAYNVSADRLKFHPKERKDNGYVLTFGDKRVYISGDTEPTPEMKALKSIDIAFLPINLPYTMLPQDAAKAAEAFKPKVLYPYHQGSSNPNELKQLLAGDKEIEVRVLALP